MATAAAAAAGRSHCQNNCDNGYVQQRIPQLKLGCGDVINAGCYMLTGKRCASSCMQRDLAVEKTTPLSNQVQCLEHLESIKAILDSLDALVYDSAGSTYSPHFEPPPSYNDSIADDPPNYDCIGDPALAQAARSYPVPPPAYFYKSRSNVVPLDQMTTPDIDFSDTSNVRQAAKKKDKQQKKQADAAKWNDEGGEGTAEGGDGGDENGGGGAGGGNNGDGGAGDDGGGDDWSGWDTGKKKKGKKAKEEEKKKQEEEEERRREEEEEANKEVKLDWADDANGDVGEDWGAYAAPINKKGKKDKKGKVEPAANGTSDFADINLDDNVPKIDLSFGPTETKESGSFGSFGGLGGNAWNGGNNWSFGGTDTTTTDIADSFTRATKDSTIDTTASGWSFGGNKKNQKKKTITSGFDSFNFGALDEEKDDEKAEEDKAVDNDNWGAFTAAGKKDKKSKKKGPFDDISNAPDPNTIGTTLPDPEPAAGDSWNAWSNPLAKNKKAKKGEEMPPPSHPAPVQHVPSEPAVGEWGGFGTKKGGKKGKNIVEVDEPAVAAVPEPEHEAEPAWGTFGKKDKKKGKKEAEKVEDSAGPVIPEVVPEVDMGKGSFSKKEKRKGSKKELETMEEPTVPELPNPDPDPDLDFGFGAFGKKDDKKGKKSKKEPEFKVEESTTMAFPEPEADMDLSFGTWGKKDDKKGKKGKKEPEKVEESTTTAFPEPEADMDLSFGTWGKKDDKKGKKGKKELEKVEEPVATAFPNAEPHIDFGFGSFGKKDDKKGKKGNKDDQSYEAAFTDAPEPEHVADIGWGSFVKNDTKKKGKKENDKAEEPWEKQLDPEPANDWADFGAKKDKDKKKAKKSSMWGEPEQEENEVLEEAPAPEIDTSWGGFSSKKDKKKGKKDNVEESKHIEPEPVVEDKPSLARTGSTKGKKGRKGLIAEVAEDPVPAIESKFAADAASVGVDDDWANGFNADKKKDKKNKRNSFASTGSKGDEAPSLPPPVPDVPDVSSFDLWGTKKDKDKDKKGKKGKIVEPDFVPAPDPEETKEVVEDDAANWAGLSAKERKKKEREREKEKREREAKEAKEKEEAEEREREEREAAEEEERKEREEAEEREREEREKKGKAKGKLGKKGKNTTSPETSKTKNLLADSIPDVTSVAQEDTWASPWGAGASKKKGGRKDMLWEAPPPAPTPPAQGLTPEPEEDLEDDALDDNWDDYPPAKSITKEKKNAKEDLNAGKKGMKDSTPEVADDKFKKSTKEDLKKKDASKDDTPAKAAKSFWGGMATTPVSKSKMSTKDKAAKEAKEKEEMEQEEDDYEHDEEEEDMIDILAEEPPSKKSMKDGKLWKTSTKESDKASKGSSGGKGKYGKSKELDATEDQDDDDGEEEAKTNNMDHNFNNIAAFSPWGTPMKKTTGKKANDDIWGKKEIAAKELTNQKATTGAKQVSNEPEPTDKDDQPWTLQPSKSLKSAMSTSKSTTTKTSSVLQRVKEFEKEKEKNNKAADFAPLDLDPEPTSKFANKAAGASSKTKDVASNKTAASKAKALSPAFKNKKNSKEEVVPGSFPGEGMDDDFNNLDEFIDDEVPLDKKDFKASAKSTKNSKITPKARDILEPTSPPTPPPEPKEEKPAKKERPRLAKEGGASSWGLWGAAPPKKKEAKAKDDADILSPPKKATAPGFTRSKSTRTAKEKDKATVQSDPKSSDSDKPKKTNSRPPKSRGSSLSALFGPPIRTKPVRKNSTTASGPKSASSRRQSVDVDATGLPSPPAEEAPEMASKAAKMMGTGKLDRKASTRGKQKASAVPDPYPIDSDDMVMVNDLDDALPEGKSTSGTTNKGSKSKSKGMSTEPGSSVKKDLPDRTKSKPASKTESSSSKRKSKIANDFDDDVVMVDAGSSGDVGVEPGPDDMQFITKPKGLQRSATSSKKVDSKSVGLGGGLFGAFRKNRRASEVNGLPRSRAVMQDEEIAPRKRTVTGGDDSAKRPRRDDRRKSEKIDRAAEGYVYDTARDVGATAEAEEADARREKRRAKRAEEDRISKEEALKYEADRRAKRREADKAKLKDDRDRRARKDEEAESRRLEDKEARRAAREARRKEEEANRALEDDILQPRSKRRSSEKEVPAASSSRPHASDRRRSHAEKATERPKSSRRKSTMAPVNDYFDPRNSRPINENDPYGGNDHTTSWVKSQVSEPPEPPPVEPTIMEPAPDFRAKGAEDLMEDEYARRASHKKPKRSSRMYTDPLGDEQEERSRRRRKEKEVRSSEGSAAEERYGGLGSMNRRPSDLGGVKLGTGTKTFDGKTGQGRRSSWFQKVTGGF